MTEEEVLRAIGNELKAAAPGKGFALFLSVSPDKAHYLSNAERETVVKALEEWLVKARPAQSASEEPSDSRDARLEHERLCSSIGRAFRFREPFTFFLFDFREGGHMAYCANHENARAGVESFLEQQRSRS